MGMEQCKRHPEMWGWPGTPCNKCIAEMGEDCIRDHERKVRIGKIVTGSIFRLCDKHPYIEALTANGNCPQCLTDEHFGVGQMEWVTAGVPCKGHTVPMLRGTLPPITIRPDPLWPQGWVVDEVQAPRWPGLRDFLTKLLNRKENSMKHVFTREISADFQDLTEAGCMVLDKHDGRELTKVVHWPKGGATTSLGLDVFKVRFIDAGFTPTRLEEKQLADLRVPYTVRVYDPSKEPDGPINTTPPGKPILVAEGATFRPPRRTITAQLEPLQSIQGAKFAGRMDQPGWRVTIPGPSTEVLTHHTFISEAPDELTCTAAWQADLSLLEDLLHFHRVPYQVEFPAVPDAQVSKSQVASIQVAATRRNDDGFEVVGENDVGRTHWSVYLRDEEGLVTHVEDYKISGFGGPARAEALQHAAGLSIQHQVPIEPIP